MRLRAFSILACTVFVAAASPLACGGDDATSSSSDDDGSQGGGSPSSSSSASGASGGAGNAGGTGGDGGSQGGTGGVAQGGMGGTGGVAQGGMGGGVGGIGGMGGMGGAAASSLLINEIDYNQVGTDAAEFIEVLNVGASDFDLTGLAMKFVNGEDNMEYGEVVLSGTLAVGQYLVVHQAGVTPAVGAVSFTYAQGMQNGGNGAGDAVAIYDTVNDVVLDAFCYTGGLDMAVIGPNMSVFDLTSGTPTTVEDDPAANPVYSLIRFPNAVDTGDDLADWTGTSLLTPGAANAIGEICDNMADDDGDNAADCADTDCAAFPACVEICDNGMDDNGNMLVDCAEMSCETQACDAFGSSCLAGACVCPGGMTESSCGNLMDDDCDGDADCADTDCSAAPVCLTSNVTGVDFPVIAHGAKLVITGSGFTGSTAVNIGGVAQMFVVDSDTQITVTATPGVLDATPTGAQDLIVTTPGGDTTPFGLTVIHLVIGEIDYDNVLADTQEFVEVNTGVPGVSLSGYSVVYVNGNGDAVIANISLGGNVVTDANGRVIVGQASTDIDPSTPLLDPPQFITATAMQNDGEAVLIIQGTLANGTVVSAATPGLIDVVVYETDAELSVLWTPPAMPLVDSNTVPAAIGRCGIGRRDGAAFVVEAAPTINAANTGCP